MKRSIILATALCTASLSAPAALAQSDQSFAGDAISIQDFVGRIEVRESQSSQISVSVRRGDGEYTAPLVTESGGRVLIDGETSMRGLQCSRRGGVVRVGTRFGSRRPITDYPTLVIEAPASLALSIDDSLFVGETGNLGSASIEVDRCGDFAMGDIAENASFEVNGSGDLTVGSIGGDARFGINGSGDIDARSVGDLRVSINGSGDIEIATQTGAFTADINGSGDINIHNGRAQPFNVGINGSGDINHGGEVVDADVDINGSGDVSAGEFSGSLRWSDSRGRVRTRSHDHDEG